MTPYETLEITQDADAATIKAAYRRLAQEHHPDRDGGDAEKFKAVKEAYELLSDPVRRKLYDDSGDMDSADLREQAEAGIIELILAAIDKLPDYPTTDDVLDTAKKKVQEIKRHNEKQITKQQTSIAKYRTQRARFTRKTESEPNFILDAIDKRISGAESAIVQHKKVITISDLSIDILNDFNYDALRGTALRGIFTQMSNSTVVRRTDPWSDSSTS